MLAVISDVHGNLEALEAVLGDIEKRDIKETFFLGDAVGYGPNPNECVSLISRACKAAVAGNHDWAVLGHTEIEVFNPVAKAAILWTKGVLSTENGRILEGFPLVKALRSPSILLVHSSPHAPEYWPYLLSAFEISHVLGSFRQRLCLVGHSHVPFIAEGLPGRPVVFLGMRAELRKGLRYIINAGSVGQPRDGDPRACYALLDGTSVELVRVEYPVRETQRKMAEAGLPAPLIERLSVGR